MLVNYLWFAKQQCALSMACKQNVEQKGHIFN